MLRKPIEVSLRDCVDVVPHLATHFHVFKGMHFLAMGINVQISVYLKFLSRPHTKIPKPYLLTKIPNFVAWEELATFPRITIICGHEMDEIII